jgi:ribosomal protein S18 acetylase RimI-like enzyme
VAAALIDDGRAAGGPLVHLGVEWDNERAQRLYRRLGFEIVGGRMADLLLA